MDLELELAKESTIIKRDAKPADVVVLVGNGAIDNGWQPLRDVLDSWLEQDNTVSKRITRLRKQDKEAFHQLALMSYKFKVSRGLHFMSWIRHKNGEEHGQPIHKTQSDGLSNIVSYFISLRSNIAQSFVQNQNNLSLRSDSEITAILGSNPHYITTNWDNTLWLDNSVTNLIHLHGRCDHADSIVFPTELIIEDTPYDFLIFKDDVPQLTPEFRLKVLSAFRCKFLPALIGAHDLASQWIRGAKKLVMGIFFG